MAAAVGGGVKPGGGEDNSITAPESRESPLPLHLKCFSINSCPTPSLLRALAATDVSSLQLDMARADATPAVCNAFRSLTSLVTLSFSQSEDPDALPLQLIQGLQGLTSLTSLELRLEAESAPYLPHSLRSLKLLFHSVEKAPLG